MKRPGRAPEEAVAPAETSGIAPGRSLGPQKVYYSTREIAELYSVGVEYLKKLRHTQKGPPYHKLGDKTILYDIRQFQEWFEAHLQLVEPAAA